LISYPNPGDAPRSPNRLEAGEGKEEIRGKLRDQLLSRKEKSSSTITQDHRDGKVPKFFPIERGGTATMFLAELQGNPPSKEKDYQNNTL